MSESLGTTLSAAMGKLDQRSLGTLEPYVKRLQTRLRRRIIPRICWERFTDETGSELASRSTRMFVDGVSLGGSPAKVADVASEYALSISLLRARRYVTSTPFAYLCIPLHGAMTGLLVFVLEIMSSFNEKMSVATDELSGTSAASQIPNMAVFQPQDMSQIALLTMGAVMVLTITTPWHPSLPPVGIT